MCELFGVSAKEKIRINEYLDVFFDHSVEHRNGWGLAQLDDGLVSIEKEPVRAIDSRYLKNRLTGNIESARFMAHIRKATVGDESFANTHPFARNDISGKKWVFVHNGTIFASPVLSPYLHVQEGSTDSERILYYIIDRVNGLIRGNGSTDDRFCLLSSVVREITPGNKVNFLLYDGEYMYVHKNEPGTLFRKKIPEGTVFATLPLDDASWEEMPQNQLLVYKDGDIIYRSDIHGNTYIHDEEKMRFQYVDHSML